MASPESESEQVIWPNRSFLDCVMAALIFLIAVAAGVGLLIAYHTGDMHSGYGAVLYAGLLVLAPVWVGIRWLRYALNAKVTIRWGGISFDRPGETACYVPWDGVQWVLWHGREDRWPGYLELKYQHQDRGKVLRLRPFSPALVRQVRWLRDHVVRRCGLEEMGSQRRVASPVFVESLPTRVWRRVDTEAR